MGNITINSSFIQKACFGNGLKSTQEKQQRQDKMEQQVAFFEQQKENLKNMECETIEEIQRKLEMFHSYEDQITAAKTEYNNQQMMHVMDEAMEQAEKIAEAAEKNKPKTEEERKEDMREEALGTEEESGALSELLEDMPETEDAEELKQLKALEEASREEEAAKEEKQAEALQEGVQPTVEQKEISEAQALVEQAKISEEQALAEQTKMSKEQAVAEKEKMEDIWKKYPHIDTKI